MQVSFLSSVAGAPAPSDNKVALIALIVSGVVGLLGPIVAALALAWRTTRELTAAAERQSGAEVAAEHQLAQQLEAERTRLTARLDAERDRLDETHHAEHAVRRHQARRDVLDTGARLLTTFNAQSLSLVPGAAPGHVLPSPDFDAVATEVGIHRARLLLWFNEDTPVIEAFDDALKEISFVTQLRTGVGNVAEQNRQALISTAQSDVEKKRLRYLAAARRVLDEEPSRRRA
jgi:hypothetical protein